MTYLLEVKSPSGRSYSLQYECDTIFDVLDMLFETGLNAELVGEVEDVQPG